MKTCEEWSREFDLLYSNIVSNQAPGLTEYEKSVFLTRAQEAVVVMLYNGTLSDSFEETEEITAYLAPLVKQAVCSAATQDIVHVVPNSQVFKLPDDLLFRTLELCKITDPVCGTRDVIVVPVTQDEYWRTARNPFKKPNSRKALRLSYDSQEGDKRYSELISGGTILAYTVRYIRKPDPIILEDLGVDGFSINGQTNAQACKLNEHLHQTILTEAVKAAKAVWAA